MSASASLNLSNMNWQAIGADALIMSIGLYIGWWMMPLKSLNAVHTMNKPFVCLATAAQWHEAL